MGKLAIISDLHVDINKFGESELMQLWQVLQKHKITRLHLAGDTANKVDRCLAVVEFFVNKGLSTTFHFGNHELADVPNEQMMDHFPDPHFLNERYIALNEQTVLLGMNGWYDYQFSELKDYEAIVRMKRLYWYDRFIQRGKTDLEVNAEMLAAAKNLLDQLEAKKLEVILSTHFVPKRAFIMYQSAPYERYSNIKQVVFGHTHRRFEDKSIGHTIYSCRPFGYYYEWQLTRDFVLKEQLLDSYDPMKLRVLLRAHHPAFQAYQTQHLQEEFEQAMTIVPY